MALIISPGVTTTDYLFGPDGWLDDPIRKIFPDLNENIISIGFKGDNKLSGTLFYQGQPVGIILICDIENNQKEVMKFIHKYNTTKDRKMTKFMAYIFMVRCEYKNVLEILKQENKDKVAHLSSILIVKPHRGKGWARILKSMIYCHLKQLGYQAVVYHVIAPINGQINFKCAKTYLGFDYPEHQVKVLICVDYL